MNTENLFLAAVIDHFRCDPSEYADMTAQTAFDRYQETLRHQDLMDEDYKQTLMEHYRLITPNDIAYFEDLLSVFFD